MARVKIVEYDDSYKEILEYLLCEFSAEVFNKGTADIDDFVNNHWAIYLATVGEEVVGFSSFVYNTYFGMNNLTVGNDYLYVIKDYRNTRAMYLLSMQSARVSIDANLPLEHYYASDTSKYLGRKLKGKKMYEAYVYDVQEIAKINNHFKTKIKLKE